MAHARAGGRACETSPAVAHSEERGMGAMATSTDLVWVELSRERTDRGEVTFAVAGKWEEARGLIAPGDPHWSQAVQALAAPPPPGKGERTAPPPVITLIPREAVIMYEAAFAAAAKRGARA